MPAMDEIITWQQALAGGLSEHDVRTRLASGQWVRLLRSWYATRPATDAADLHRLRLRAWAQVYEGRAVASHVSAALALGLPLHDVDLGTVHLARTGDGRSKSIGGFHLHARPQRMFAPVHGVEHAAIAVLQLAAHSLEAGLVAGDAAVRRGLATPEQLIAAAAAFGACRGSARMRQVGTFVDGRHESPGETLTAQQLRLAGIAADPQFAVPGTQGWTASGVGYTADFRVVGERVLIEFDGKVKYGRGDDLWLEKRREDRIRSLGWWFVRPVWADLVRRGRIEAMVRGMVAVSRAGYRDLPAS